MPSPAGRSQRTDPNHARGVHEHCRSCWFFPRWSSRFCEFTGQMKEVLIARLNQARGLPCREPRQRTTRVVGDRSSRTGWTPIGDALRLADQDLLSGRGGSSVWLGPDSNLFLLGSLVPDGTASRLAADATPNNQASLLDSGLDKQPDACAESSDINAARR